MKRTDFLIPAVLLALGGCAKAGAGNDAATDSEAAATQETVPLIVTSSGKAHRFDVEVALTPQAQEKGLMFRKELGPDSGMVFPMSPPRTASFWMKNTVIPLDMLFIRTDGSIALVASNAKPYDLTPVSAGIPVSGVIELAGGRATALGIREGDKVKWGACALPDAARKASSASEQFCP